MWLIYFIHLFVVQQMWRQGIEPLTFMKKQNVGYNWYNGIEYISRGKNGNKKENY